MRADRLRAAIGRADRVLEGGMRALLHRASPKVVPGIVIDALLAGAVIGDAFLGVSKSSMWETVCACVAALAMFLRRRAPRLAWFLTIPALFVGYSLIGPVFALVNLAQRTSRVWTLTVAAFVMFAGFGSAVLPLEDLDDVLLNALYGALLAGGPIAFGQALRIRRALDAQILELRALRELEREQAAAAALARERALLAREMHDVVSHQVTLIAVQAGAMQIAGPDAVTRGFARTVRDLCVTTLQELREMVNVLRRSGGSTRDVEPQPVLEQLPELVASSGLDVTLTGTISADLPSTHQRAVFRFVQEALTNARKHAPGASIAVSLHEGADVTVLVRNAHAVLPALDLPGSGLGLIGLRERAAVLHGEVRSARTSDGGFEIMLRFPVPSSSA